MGIFGVQSIFAHFLAGFWRFSLRAYGAGGGALREWLARQGGVGALAVRSFGSLRFCFAGIEGALR